MTQEIIIFFLIGGLAQLVDGALGMAFGVISTSLLLSFGITPAVTSATVHACKIATGAASGFSHLALGNVDRRLLLQLALPGAIGAMIGAYVLTTLPVEIARPLVAIYLFIMGILILRRALRQKTAPADEAVGHRRSAAPLGLVGGFLDATGGGGWGPIVTSGLLVRNMKPATAIGTANLAEFVVAICAAGVFLAFASFYLPAIIGLTLGGALTAPIAAYLTKRIPAKLVLGAVAVLIFALSVRTTVVAISGWQDKAVAATETEAVVLNHSDPAPGEQN
jgi:uncharacterized membrane protein YfcA